MAGSVKKEGWLMKKSLNAFVLGSQKRWFTLHEGIENRRILTYSESKGSPAKGNIVLTAIRGLKVTGAHLTIQVEGRAYEMTASSNKEALEWSAAIDKEASAWADELEKKRVVIEKARNDMAAEQRRVEWERMRAATERNRKSKKQVVLETPEPPELGTTQSTEEFTRLRAASQGVDSATPEPKNMLNVLGSGLGKWGNDMNTGMKNLSCLTFCAPFCAHHR